MVVDSDGFVLVGYGTRNVYVDVDNGFVLTEDESIGVVLIATSICESVLIVVLVGSITIVE